MIATANPKVKNLLDPSIKKNGPAFSSAISDLGDGLMQNGVKALWNDGALTGVGVGVAGTTAVFCICILGQKAIHKHRVNRALAQLGQELEATPVPPNDTAHPFTAPEVVEDEAVEEPETLVA